ncbi:Ribonuclease HI [Candidatus Magnetaquicoccaceae bacterium FCR-1]|uniref:Ribonuclease H n=2 Tax=Candidatus Magnetaquiglobus chichijimensis TaxID=3141448 RepID=A0ABQ0C5D6_9PROT
MLSMDTETRTTPRDTASSAEVCIYTDGACSGNPGPGGWGALLQYGPHAKNIRGFSPRTTNNRMEILAAIHALETLNRPCRVIINTDSSYVKNGITQWLPGWKSRGWRKSDGKPVLNVELWQRLDAVCRKHEVEWRWVRGHAGDPGNEAADQLAREAIESGRVGALAPDPAG